MCGIAGYAGWGHRHEESSAHLSAMCDAIRHRGPDDDGHFIAEDLALGMRRLSIIDLNTGRQPISNEDGTVIVVFNGEIYNYRDLREQLVANGHTVATRSDTETLVHLYEDHREGLVEVLNGMFAFALWDSRSKSLLLARDRLGIKPLYYWEHQGGIAFASDLRSLRRLPNFEATIDLGGIADYMVFGYIPEPGTAFEGVRKLPPGHTLTWTQKDGARLKQYWHPAEIEAINISEEEAVDEIRRLLDDAVRLRLIADVPLGAFLSGGVDSSAIVATMVRKSSAPVRTFSIGFEEAEYDEAQDAARFARDLGTDHTALVVRPDVNDLIESVVESFGEPFADASAIPTYLVSELASQHVKVVLSGDGGDELFSGYTRYLQISKRSELRPRSLRHLFRYLGRRLPSATPGRNRILDLSRSRRGRYTDMVGMSARPDEGGVCRPHLVERLPTFDHQLDPWFDRVAHRDFQSQVSLVDLSTYLVGDILTKVDRMSMACSLEARVPLLDHRMVEFAMSLPIGLKLGNARGKLVFRSAIADRVPRAVLTRSKQGFAMPLDRWFRNELGSRLDDIMGPSSPVHDFLDSGAVSRAVQEHRRRRRDHSYLLWRVLVLHLWLENLDLD